MDGWEHVEDEGLFAGDGLAAFRYEQVRCWLQLRCWPQLNPALRHRNLHSSLLPYSYLQPRSRAIAASTPYGVGGLRILQFGREDPGQLEPYN